MAGGGNSHQRAKNKKANKELSAAVKEMVQQLQIERSGPTSGPEQTLPVKLRSVWHSTPVWSALSMIFGLIFSRIFVAAVYVVAGIILGIEFASGRFFRTGWRTIVGNGLAALIIAALLFVCWALTPKPSSLEQQVDQEMTAFAKRFPWLASPPQQQSPMPGQIQISKPEKPKVEFGSDTRAFLKSVPLTSIIDDVGHELTVRGYTANIGALDAKPHAAIFAFIRFRKEMTEAEENELFEQFQVGGGKASWNYNRVGYWARADTQPFEVTGSPEFEIPEDFARTWDEVNQGSLLAYVLIRHIYEDKLGRMVTESCYIMRGPKFIEMRTCLTHNGPRLKPYTMTTPSQ
jgi:hypothetical protein